MKDTYESPLSSRYASKRMLWLFSPDMRYTTWRRLWAALAEAQSAMGLDISAEQVAELRAHIDDIDYGFEAEEERRIKHDVMAHIHTYARACSKASGIIHLGATSCYVTDNADLIIYREALREIRAELVSAASKLAAQAERYGGLPALGYTHYQPAQPVTMGKRFCLWLQDLMTDLDDLDFLIEGMSFLGCRGTTGTEASFMELFGGDAAKIDEMNRRIAAEFGFSRCFSVCGQTYPRKLDSRILGVLSGIAQSCCRMATDIRLLQHDRQLEEPFAEDQVGSSAMAYKRNPVRCERICSLSRYVMADAANACMTASSQWMERTLDDSANRRISLPEAFLAADAVLRLTGTVAEGLRVNEKLVLKALYDYMPFISTENILMDAVKRGADRQRAHEIIRERSMEAVLRMRDGGECGLLEALAAEEELRMSEDDLRASLDPACYVGRCPEQVSSYLAEIRPRLEGAAEVQKVEI